MKHPNLSQLSNYLSTELNRPTPEEEDLYKESIEAIGFNLVRRHDSITKEQLVDISKNQHHFMLVNIIAKEFLKRASQETISNAYFECSINAMSFGNTELLSILNSFTEVEESERRWRKSMGVTETHSSRPRTAKVIPLETEHTLKNNGFSFFSEKSLKQIVDNVVESHKTDKRLNALNSLRAKKQFFGTSEVDETKIDALINLKSSMPDFSPIINDIILDLKTSLLFGDKKIKFQNILIVSPPGVGKNYFVNKLSKILNNTTFHKVSCNKGMLKSFTEGLDPSFKDSKPSGLIQGIVSDGICNPVVVLDELDHGLRDNPTYGLGALLSLLENETNHDWIDNWYQIKFDTSQCNWIALSNDINSIPENVLSRFNIYHIDSNSIDETKISSMIDEIVSSKFYKAPFEIPRKLCEASMQSLQTNRLSSRELKRKIEMALREYAIKVVSEPDNHDTTRAQTICIGEHHSKPDTYGGRIGFLANL